MVNISCHWSSSLSSSESEVCSSSPGRSPSSLEVANSSSSSEMSSDSSLATGDECLSTGPTGEIARNLLGKAQLLSTLFLLADLECETSLTTSFPAAVMATSFLALDSANALTKGLSAAPAGVLAPSFLELDAETPLTKGIPAASAAVLKTSFLALVTESARTRGILAAFLATPFFDELFDDGLPASFFGALLFGARLVASPELASPCVISLGRGAASDDEPSPDWAEELVLENPSGS
eukprot:CAMPEP_0115125908 /NCGR_PEP_ID=MMETSP0227-20121206/49357_1 /TAXON_ID=89957 /ORGANISM="Polarella glacialis, Strain CCMP 1383" /LENGTH=237 /DNA_ID=CAMNT_0002529439 /DNA_START=37 /DNA_END=750 /DNA_ORIENTATION=-